MDPSYSCSCYNKSHYVTNSYGSDTYHHHHQQFPSQHRNVPPQARKTQAKNNNHHSNKRHIAPSLPNPPRIYKVEPKHFKEVVQMLTCAPEFQPSTLLQEAAPPPLSLSPPHHKFSSGAALSPTPGFNLLSPASLTWCSSFLMSPGTTGPSPAII